MKRLSDEEIDYYASHGEWRGKAGGYALQGYGEVYVRHIAGSYSNVVGLPLAETRVLLKSRRISACLNGSSSAGSARPARCWSRTARSSKRGSSSRARLPAGSVLAARLANVGATAATRSPATKAASNICFRAARRA